MIFSLPIPEEDSLLLPPVHYTTHLILFYFKLFLFSDQPCLCLPFPKPTAHTAWHWHCPSKHCLPEPGELPQRRQFPCTVAVEYNTEPSTEKLKRRLRSNWDSEVSTSNFCLTTSTNNYLLEIQLHDGLLEVPHSTMDQFSAPAAGPRWEIISF